MSTAQRIDVSRFRSLSESDADMLRRLLGRRLAPACEPNEISNGIADGRLGGMPATMSSWNVLPMSTNGVRRRLTFDSCDVENSSSRSAPYLGSDDDDGRSNSLFLCETSRDIEAEQRNRWNFDFKNFEPLPGRFVWSKVDSGNEKADLVSAAVHVPPNNCCFIPIERDCCRGEDDDDLVTWRSTVTTTANAQTQTRPEEVSMHPVADRLCFPLPTRQDLDDTPIGDSVALNSDESGSNSEPPVAVSSEVSRHCVGSRWNAAAVRSTSAAGRVARPRRITTSTRQSMSSVKYYFATVKKPTSRNIKGGKL